MNTKIFITGFMGSGKTFWGKIWAKQNHLNFFDLDAEIEKSAGEPVAAIFENKGEPYFRNMETEVLKKFSAHNDFILACGGGTPCFFDNLTWMNQQGTTIYLRASANEIFERISSETLERPLLSKVDPSELRAFIGKKLSEREPFYKRANHILNVNVLSAHSLHAILAAR